VTPDDYPSISFNLQQLLGIASCNKISVEEDYVHEEMMLWGREFICEEWVEGPRNRGITDCKDNA
jgi:hypothetical protein